MGSSTNEPTVVRVSQKGQATIPKPLREKFGIETPGEVFVYEEDGRIVVEPIPSIEELGGIHGDDRADGEILESVRELKAEDKRRENDRVAGLEPSESRGDE